MINYVVGFVLVFNQNNCTMVLRQVELYQIFAGVRTAQFWVRTTGKSEHLRHTQGPCDK